MKNFYFVSPILNEDWGKTGIFGVFEVPETARFASVSALVGTFATEWEAKLEAERLQYEEDFPPREVEYLAIEE